MDIFLVGNGFDLAHNLPTKYENFLHTIMFLIQNYNKKMITVGHVFGDSRLRADDWWINKCYEVYSTGWAHSNLKADEVDKLIDRARENIWFRYFSDVINQDLGWIDFEREISYVITAFSEFFLVNEERSFVLEQCLSDESLQYIISRFLFYHDFADVSTPILNTYSTTYNVKTQYCVEFPRGSGSWIINKEAIVDKLFHSLDEFSFILQEYLRIFIEQPLETLIHEKLIELNPKFINASQVITFNYSSVFEKVYKLKQVIHIHGTINEKIVLGVNPNKDDDLQTVDTTFLQFKKYYQRVRFGTDLRYLNFLEHNEMTRKSHRNVVTVVGHSLDVTDKDVIMEVFELADEIHILYHNEKAIGGYIKNLVKIYGKEGFDRLRSVKKLRFEAQSV